MLLTTKNVNTVYILSSTIINLRMQASLYARDKSNIPVVALDIAGAEDGFPAEEHKEAYHLAHKNFMHKTVHAGEACGPESIFQALTGPIATCVVPR